MQLQSQLDVNSLEINELKALVKDLLDSLDQKKTTYKALKRDIKRLDDQSEALKVELNDCEDELD